jgi:nitrogen PTS system EIIA component
MQNEVLTLDEVARMLRVSERTVTDWATRGELPGGKLGTSWRFKRSEVERWLDAKLSPRISASAEETRPLNALLSPSRVALLDKHSKGDALNALIDLCANIPGVRSREELAEAVFVRERLMSTGIGLGIGVPHVRLGGVRDVYVAAGVNTTPLHDYESLDQEPVQIIVMIVAGRDQHARYIKTLSRVSELLKDSGVRSRILGARSPQELYALLTSGGA